MATFKMGLKDMEAEVDYRALNLSLYDDNGQRLNILEQLLPAEISPFSLFSYLFRRFGYPNMGWDAYKELTNYCLSTACPEMLLIISLRLNSSSYRGFSFYVPKDIHEAIENYERRDIQAYEARRLQWIEGNVQKPQWMDEFFANCLAAQWCSSEAKWTDAVQFCPLFDETAEDSWSMVAPWYEYIIKKYDEIETRPQLNHRCPQWQHWSDDDPLKKYVLGIEKTLDKLKHPVRVRDQHFDMFGTINGPGRVLHEASVAGYPSAALGNIAPEEFAQLHTIVLKLGKGNAKKGINQILNHYKDDDVQ